MAPKTSTPTPVPTLDVELDAMDEVDFVTEDDDEIELDDESLDSLLTEIGLDLTFEDRPKSGRGGRKPSPKVPWEKALAGLKESAGRDVRLFIFPVSDYKPTEKSSSEERARQKAVGRATEIRKRLFQQSPSDYWNVTARFAESDESCPGPSYRVYGMFVRALTKEETQDRIEKRQAASERIRAARNSG